MSKKTKLLSYVEIDDNTPIQKLGVFDMFRVILRKLSEDASSELKAQDAVTKANLTLKANLLDFLEKGVTPMREGRSRGRQFEVSNAFEPILDEVIAEYKRKPYYDIKVIKPDIEYDIPYNITIIITVKEDN